MKIREVLKEVVFQAGLEVFFGYLFLNLITKSFPKMKKDKANSPACISLKKAIEDLILTHTSEQTLIFQDHAFDLKITETETNQWEVKMTTTESVQTRVVKSLDKYQAEDLISLCQSLPLKVTKTEHGEFKFSTEISFKEKKVVLGGPGKLELYALHLSTLQAMLAHTQDPIKKDAMLVAMATGSGKSFIQALWFLIQYLIDNPCYFAVPNEALALQLKTDFERLLPESVTQHLLLGEDQGHGLDKWKIMTHHQLLKSHWAHLTHTKTQATSLMLCIDEEHLTTREELFKKRVDLLAEQYSLILFSATPSEMTYQLTGQPVASLSKHKKEALGLAKPAHSMMPTPRGAIKQGRKREKLSLFESTLMNVAQLIQPEEISVAHAYIDECETTLYLRAAEDRFYAPVDSNQIRLYLRWNFCMPIGEKALILTHGHEPVVNMSLLRDESKRSSRTPYSQGNQVDRGSFYRGIKWVREGDETARKGENLDSRCIESHRQAKLAHRKQQCFEALSNAFPDVPETEIQATILEQIDFSETNQYLQHRVLHGLIESSLNYLLGYDSQTLDELRFQNADKLLVEVNQKMSDFFQQEQENVKKLRQSLVAERLPPSVADELTTHYMEVLRWIRNSSAEEKKRIVDNWSLDLKLHQERPASLQGFLDKYQTLFLLSGLENSPSSIASNKPFFNLEYRDLSLFHKNVLNNPVLRHPYRPFEILVQSNQLICEPHYCTEEYTPMVVDTLFRKGLVGAYITSEKALGFNDTNLNHVCILDTVADDVTGSPEYLIQGAGRNRGLNEARQPFFFLLTDRDELNFTPEKLDLEEYFPAFFKAKKNYLKRLNNKLGEKIAFQIKEYLTCSAQKSSHLLNDGLETELVKIMLDEFEEVYRHAHFNFEKARAHFLKVLTSLNQSLKAENNKLKHLYETSFKSRFILAVIRFFLKIYYFLATSGSYRQFVSACKNMVKEGNEKPFSANEETYIHILGHYHYSDLIKMNLPLIQLVRLVKSEMKACVYNLRDKSTPLEEMLGQRIEKYLKSDFLKSFFDLVLNPLNEKQLYTLLNVIFPDDGDGNTQKARLLKSFHEDLAHLDGTELFKKYATHGDANFKETHLMKIMSWIKAVYDEILDCKCYWHNMTTEGISWQGREPTLKLRSESIYSDHAIWSHHSTTPSQNSATLARAKRIEYLSATQASLKLLSQVESLGNQRIRERIEEVRTHFVTPLKHALAGKETQTGGLFAKAIELGKGLALGTALTVEEVASPDTLVSSAVQKLRM